MKSLFLRAVGVAILFAVSFGAAASMMPRFDELEQTLKIRPEQKDQFDMAVGATQRALLSVGLTALQLKQKLAQELAKPRPDFGALARAHEDVIEQNRPLFKAAGAEWKKLYAILDDEQIAIARSFVEDKLGLFLRR
jgi:hypothetical protein